MLQFVFGQLASCAASESNRSPRADTPAASPPARRKTSCPHATRGTADWSGSSPPARGSPLISPACGPPSNLSPLKVMTSTPARRLSAIIGSPCTPTLRRSNSSPLPRSSITGMLCLRPSSTNSSSEGCSVKPTIWKFERCTRSSSLVFSVIALRNRRCACDSWCPPRAAPRLTSPSRRECETSRRSPPARRARR